MRVLYRFFSPRSFDRTLSCKRGLRLELVGAWQKSGRNEDAFVRIKSGSLIHPSPSFFCSIWIGKNSLTQFRRRLERVSRRVLPFNCSFKVYQPSPAVRLKRLKRETKLWYSQWSRIQSEGVSFNRTRFLINKRNLCTPLLPRSFSL